MPRAEIATKQAKFTLDQLHAELAGKLAENKEEGERLAEALQHVEATLKLLDPSYSLRGIAVRRRKPNPYFKRGTVFRAVLDALRKATGPMTAHEITLAMLTARNVTSAPDKAVRDLEGAVRSALRIHTGKSIAIVGDGMPARWKIIGGNLS